MKYFLIFIIIFELYTSFQFAVEVGFWWSLFETIATSFVGLFILKNFKTSLAHFGSIISMQGGNLDTLKKSIFKYIIGAIFLIIPGIITDVLGLLILISGLPLLFTSKVQAKPTQEKNDTTKDYIDVEVL